MTSAQAVVHVPFVETTIQFSFDSLHRFQAYAMAHYPVAMINSQISAHKESGQFLWVVSPVMQQWPWLTDIPLEKGSLVDAVNKRVGELPQDSDLLNMILVRISRYFDIPAADDT